MFYLKPLQFYDIDEQKGTSRPFPFILSFPIGLAPMAGVSDLAFRSLAAHEGAGLLTSELISARGLRYKGLDDSWLYLQKGEQEKHYVIQLFGAEPEDFLRACERLVKDERLKGFVMLDINMGCPVPKVCKTGAGSALMKDILRSQEIVKAARSVCSPHNIPVTVKFRKGYEEGKDLCEDFSLAMIEAGAAMLTIHGRSRQAMYSGKADWKAIARSKQAVRRYCQIKRRPDVPLLANGDIVDEESALACLIETQADGLQIGRAARGNPWIFKRLLHFFTHLQGLQPSEVEKAKLPWVLSREERGKMIARHFQILRTYLEEERACLEFRKVFAWYTQGEHGAAALRREVMKMQKEKDFYVLLGQYFAYTAS